MENRIKKVMSEVLELEISSINESTSPETVESWDSLKQMNLIVALEEEFDIELEDEHIIEMMDYKSILENVGKLV